MIAKVKTKRVIFDWSEGIVEHKRPPKRSLLYLHPVLAVAAEKKKPGVISGSPVHLSPAIQGTAKSGAVEASCERYLPRVMNPRKDIDGCGMGVPNEPRNVPRPAR